MIMGGAAKPRKKESQRAAKVLKVGYWLSVLYILAVYIYIYILVLAIYKYILAIYSEINISKFLKPWL